MDEKLAPMSSPSGFQRHRQTPQGLPLPEYERRTPDWSNWNVWAKRHPLSRLLQLPRIVDQTFGHSIGPSIADAGDCLGQLYLAARKVGVKRTATA